MKHLLNNISEEEKNSILEQHKGGMKIFNENFNKMVNKKLGQVDLYEQSEKTPSTSTENTRKLSDIDQGIFGSSDNVEREARTIVDGDKRKIKYGLATLRLFRMVSIKIYELNQGKENATTQVLYMDPLQRFRDVINKNFNGDNTEIIASERDRSLGGGTFNYGDLKKYWNNTAGTSKIVQTDEQMAELYNSWLDTKLKA